MDCGLAHAVRIAGARLPLEGGGLGCVLETSVAQGPQSTLWGITCVGAGTD